MGVATSANCMAIDCIHDDNDILDKKFDNFNSRYVIRRRSAWSCTGSIYEAFDFQLERVVCIKEVDSLLPLLSKGETVNSPEHLYHELNIYKKLD